MLKKIYWIASYPKSGNTWMRSIVASLLFSKDGLFNFGLLKLIEQFDKKKWFEFIEKNNFDIKNISKYWIEAQERIIIEDNYNILFNFFKTHSLNAIMDNNQFTNTNVSGGLVYLIRDPRDVVISFSKHRGEDIDSTINFITNHNSIFPEDSDRIASFLSRWDLHYESWQKINIPKITIKYEDLIYDTKKTILKIADFFKNKLNFDIDMNIDKINNIFESTKFDKFKEFEEKNGFSEASKNSNFFREGKTNQWERVLTNIQSKKIEKEFEIVMKKFNYM